VAPNPDRPYPRLVVRSLLPVLLLAAAGALAISACDAQFLPEAARVNGAFVSQSTLNSALDSVASDSGYRCLLESSASGKSAVTGVSSGTYSASFAAGTLSLLIEAKAADVAFARAHLAVTPLAREVARGNLSSSFTPSEGSACTEPGSEVLATLGGGFEKALVGLQSDEDVLAARAVGASLSTAGVLAYAGRHARAIALDCTDAIEVASRAKAEQLRMAILGGASFATVARQNSLDASASNGGELGCITASELTPPLGTTVASLPIGVISQPIDFSGEWLLFLVSSRRAPTLPQAAAEIVAAGTSSAAKEIDRFVAEAHVQVDPRYGTWTKVGTTYEVKAPKSPALRLLPNPSAVGA
jgi:PPIC-type PPIASE domain